MISYTELKSGDVIYINDYNNRKAIAIFDKFTDGDDIYAYSTQALHVLCESVNDKTFSNELYIPVKDCEFCYDTKKITYRLANEDEITSIYNRLTDHFKNDYDPNWKNNFTDSSYYDVLYFLLNIFNIELDEDNNVHEWIEHLNRYIYDKLREEMGLEPESYGDINNIQCRNDYDDSKDIVLRWFKEIYNAADVHKNHIGYEMTDNESFEFIKCIARNAMSCIERYYDIKDISNI